MATKRKSTAASNKRVAKKEIAQESPVIEPVVEKKAAKAGEEGIDIVVPMVFPYGPGWLEKYREACYAYGRKYSIDSRVRSWDLERYFFRGIAKNLPFVRKVHLILADEGQIPFWVNREKVHIVLHKDIIPEELLPTFNSSTIEMWIHNIDGLSETFIYCNDDMIAVSPLTAEDFFVDGKPKTFCKEVKTPLVGEFLYTIKHAQNIAAKDFGKEYDEDIFLRDGHSYAPFLLSALNDIVAKHGDEMRESCTQFRENNNINQYLYTYVMCLAGMNHDGYHPHKYYSISSDYDKMTADLLRGDVGVACFNDAGIGDWREMNTALYKVMQKILGDKCEYEI